MKPQELTDLMPVVGGHHRPDWVAIADAMERNGSDPAVGWPSAARHWVDLSADRLGSQYKVTETENFLLLTSLSERHVHLLTEFVERALSEILSRLEGIASDEGFGKHVALIFHDQDVYYEYVSYFMSLDGEYPLSSGMFLNSDYGHFVLPYYDFAETEATIAHELTHACVRHIPIPLWLNEGFAVTLEDELCGTQPLRMDPERLAEHRAFWDPLTIQEFWNGRSFGRVDEGGSLSYELARYCLRSLAHDIDAFTAFSNEASFCDGGEAAAIQFFGGGLGGLIEQFFGSGAWAPEPDTWEYEEEAVGDRADDTLHRTGCVLWI